MQSELKRSDSPQVQRSGDSGSREAGIRVIGQHSVTTPAAHKKGLLKEQLELERVKTKDGRVRYTIKSIEEQLAFDKGFYVFVRALQMLKSQNDGVIMVGLGGPSGSGKTAFSTKVFNFMPGVWR